MSGQQYKVAWLCEALLVSRSGYYDWKERRTQPGPRQLENLRLRGRIQEEFKRSRRTYGSPRLAQALGCPGRRNRIARLMRAQGLFARQRSKYRAAKTNSRHGGPIAPNRVPDLAVQHPNQLWVSDATGILTAQGWLYLVAVLDVYSRRVVGWAMSPMLDAPLTLRRLAHGSYSAPTGKWPHPPLRSRQSIRQRRLSPAPGSTWAGCLHESSRKLLR